MFIGGAEEEDDFFYTMQIEDWLDGPYAVYVKQFKDAGYDDTTFLMGMKEPDLIEICLLYTSPSPRDGLLSRMPSSA